MVEFKMLLVTGSRDIKDQNYVEECIEEAYFEYQFNTILEGGAIGVDELAHSFAISHKFNHFTLYPDWNKYGNKAGFVRNKDLVEVCNKGIAIWDGKSNGTKDTIDKLKKAGKLIKVFIYLE